MMNKKIFLWLIFGLLLLFSDCNALSLASNDIKEYLEDQILSHHSINIPVCNDAQNVHRLFSTLKQGDFFDVENYGNKKYFNILLDFVLNNHPTNLLMRSLFPYLDSKYIENGEWLSLFCNEGDGFFHAGWFQVRWTIYLKKENIDIIYSGHSTSTSRPTEKTEIYFQIKDALDPLVKKLSYNKDGVLFLGCSTNYQSQYITPHFARIRRRLGDKNYSYYVDDRFYVKTPYLELTQYDGKDITLRFYVDPFSFQSNSNLECENSRMLKYEIVSENEKA